MQTQYGPAVTPHKKPNAINNLTAFQGDLPPTPKQSELFHVEKQAEFDGVEMGVLESGVPYLSGRGLARMCGIDHKSLHEMAVNWQEERHKPRGKVIHQLLVQAGYDEDALFLRSEHNGTEINAYVEPVCLAILEYFAFLSKEPRQEAIRAFRTLARRKFREFVYEAVGYNPEKKVLDQWKHFHDRVDLTHDAAPAGHWGVFREIAIMIVPMIRGGVMISDRVVPDISVGRAWSEYWQEAGLESRFGARTRYDHSYPDYYPQAKSNPQPSYAYPNAALGVFREWLQENYILNKFPKYLLGQANKGALRIEAANKVIQSFGGKQIEYRPRTRAA